MNKKLLILPVTAILLAVVISGCTSPPDNNTLYFEIGDKIPVSYCSTLNASVTIFYSTTCPVCKTTLPRLQLLEAKLRTANVSFEYIAVDTPAGLERANVLKMFPYHVPTVIINCTAYGSMSEDEYEQIILSTVK